MARYSREARLRAIKAGVRPPIMCPSCGQNFWNEEQKREHIGISAGKSYCQYAPAGRSHADTVEIAHPVSFRARSVTLDT